MSTLSKKEKMLADALARVLKEAVVSAALIKVLEDKGRPLMEEARTKLVGMQLSPYLEVVLEKVTPKDVMKFKFGIKFLRDSDEVWDGVVTKILGKNHFTKRGMSAYFMRYIEAMVKLERMMRRESQLKHLLEEHKGSFVAILLGSEAQSLINEGLAIVATMFGYTAILSEQIPTNPDTMQKRLGVYLWKMANGATATDYEQVRRVADEFLAGSMGNHRIAQLAHL